MQRSQLTSRLKIFIKTTKYKEHLLLFFRKIALTGVLDHIRKLFDMLNKIFFSTVHYQP